jgi:hypothetical protein
MASYACWRPGRDTPTNNRYDDMDIRQRTLIEGVPSSTAYDTSWKEFEKHFASSKGNKLIPSFLYCMHPFSPKECLFVSGALALGGYLSCGHLHCMGALLACLEAATGAVGV